MLYPSFHALFTAVLGWLGAVLVYLVLEQVINRMLRPISRAGQSICFLMSWHSSRPAPALVPLAGVPLTYQPVPDIA
jgi:hypothetical protein